MKLKNMFSRKFSPHRVSLTVLLYVSYLLLANLAIPYAASALLGANGLPTILFMLIVAPALSFFIPRLVIGMFAISRAGKILWYTLHTIVVIAVPILVLTLVIISIVTNIGSF
jgi:hypothetical protein